jgi:hypothetical protein
MNRGAVGVLLALAGTVAACGGRDVRPEPHEAAPAPRSGPLGDADILGREVFELVDRAVDYRGSHRGRPASSLRQMGVDSLTPSTARVLLSIEREPVVTVSFRKVDTRAIVSCRGDSHILEEAALNGGRFTLMCASRSGAQRPIQVGP